jgi:hypothetical protein
MQDTLERERLIDNLIDRVFRLEERVARLEENQRLAETAQVVIPEPATGGRWALYVVDMGGEVGPVLAGKEL